MPFCLHRNIPRHRQSFHTNIPIGGTPGSASPIWPEAVICRKKGKIPGKKNIFTVSREALTKSARAGSEGFCSHAKDGKWRNTLCISHFSSCGMGTRDPLSGRRRFIQSFPRKALVIEPHRSARLPRRTAPGGIASETRPDTGANGCINIENVNRTASHVNFY